MRRGQRYGVRVNTLALYSDPTLRGVPAAVPALGGLAETVGHGVSGLVFPPNGVTALAQLLLDLASGHSFPEHTIDQMRVAQVQQRFSRARHVDRIRAIMHEIVPAQLQKFRSTLQSTL